MAARYQDEAIARFEGNDDKGHTCSLISIAILGVMQTSSVAGDCYFNNITLEPPDFARCYPQQSVSPTQKESIGHRGRRGRLNRHVRH
jgi:hypothetical protein